MALYDSNNIKKFGNELTPELAIDCEMVEAFDGKQRFSACAKVSIVNAYLEPVFDTYVKTDFHISDYRTAYSGIVPWHLENAPRFTNVRTAVLEIINGRILVGHDLKQDLTVLQISHPRMYCRDTSRLYYSYFKRDEKPSLKRLSSAILGLMIQKGAHDSLEDARASMKLYLLWCQRNDGKIVKLDDVSTPVKESRLNQPEQTVRIADLSSNYLKSRS